MTDLQNILNEAIARHNVPGAVALIGNSTTTLASAAAGFSDPSSNKVMTRESLFQIASMTKAITSVAAMQLVERGVLALDAPIGNILPELSEPSILTGFDAQGAPQTQPAETAITLRYLLTHTSGLGYSFASADMAKAQGDVQPGTKASLMAPLMFEPGTDWLYGVGTDWVGLAVEAASGQSLGEFMTENIFGPLKMNDTGFAVAPENQDRRTALHAKIGDGFAAFPLEIGGGDAAEFQSGGGGLYSTAPDYLKFMQMILNQGKCGETQILSPASIAEMSRNQTGTIRAGAMQTVLPQIANDFDCFPEMDTRFGLGFLINPETGPDGRAAGSLTWAGIANCYYWIDPTHDIAGVVLMQYLPFADPGALEVFSQIEAAAYSA